MEAISRAWEHAQWLATHTHESHGQKIFMKQHFLLKYDIALRSQAIKLSTAENFVQYWTSVALAWAIA